MSTNEKRKWIIYMYTFPSGKRYVGKTSQSLKDRQEGPSWTGYGNSTILMKAVRKYGIENIQEEILFENNMTDEYAARLEQICILLFKANCLRFSDPAYGYNMTDGGEGTLGYRHSNESKQKMSESKKRCIGDSANSSKPVCCVELDRIFPNGVYAEKETGVNRKLISQALHSKNKRTHGGNTGFEYLHWDFAEKKPRPNKEEQIKTPIKRSYTYKRVYCYEHDRYLNSVYDAEEEGYGSSGLIRKCCNGYINSVTAKDGRSYHFLYEDDVNDENINKIILLIEKDMVYCVELNMYFASTTEAESLGYGNKRKIRDNCSGRLKLTHLPNGEIVHWLSKQDVNESNILKSLTNNDSEFYISVYCIEQNKFYFSTHEAERKNNLPKGHVSLALRGKLKNIDNETLHWITAKEAIKKGVINYGKQ